MSNSKAQGVKDCVKWLIKQIQIQEQQSLLEKEEFERDQHYRTDLTEPFFQMVHDRKIKIETMIEIKISLQKYATKLKYQNTSE